MIETNEAGEATAEGCKLFHTMKGLNKNMIGQYLGRNKEFNKQVLHHYTYMAQLKPDPGHFSS